MQQINLFEYYPSLIAEPSDTDITDLQLQKIYDGLYDLKKFRRKIVGCDIDAVVERMTSYTKHGCLGVGIGCSANNPTTFWLDRRGIEFDNDGIFHSFRDVALLLINRYGQQK